MEDKLVPVFIGAVLALAASVLLQAIVVPMVQARTRRRERWERAVSELAVVVADELPKALAEYRQAAEMERLFRALKDQPGYDQVKVADGLQKASTARREADEVVTREGQKLIRLKDHVVSRRRRSPDWWDFQMKGTLLWGSTAIATIAIHLEEEDPSDDEWREKWRAYAEKQKEFASLVEALELSMRPPPRRLVKRCRAAIKQRFKKAKPELT